METQQAASSPIRFCAEVPVACIPANYRKRLPRPARLCYVEEPVWDEASDAYFTRIGGTPHFLAASRPLRLSVEEAEVIFQALDHPASEEPPVYAAPSYVLPEALRELDHSRSCDLNGELAQAMLSHAPTPAAMASPLAPTRIERAVDSGQALPEDDSSPQRLSDPWFVAPTSITDDEGRCLVWTAPLSHRLSGRSSGLVYTAWLDSTTLEQAMPVEASFDGLDCHEQRVQVNAFALAQGARPPVEEPEPVQVAEAAFTATTLDEQYQLIPLKDPIYLRNEDVIARHSDAETITLLDTSGILTNAIAVVQHEQASLAVLPRRDTREVRRLETLLCCLEETLNWYRQLPRQRHGPPILSLSPLDAMENEPVRGQGQRQPRCVQLVVGVPTTLPLPWPQLADAFCWPPGAQARARARSGQQATGVRIVA